MFVQDVALTSGYGFLSCLLCNLYTTGKDCFIFNLSENLSLFYVHKKNPPLVIHSFREEEKNVVFMVREPSINHVYRFLEEGRGSKISKS